MEAVAKYFDFQKKGTNFAREARGGLTTFLAMVYILAVNPSVLSAAGMPADGVFAATVLSSAFACIYMGLRANLPIALAPGMGLNAYFAYTVCGAMGKDWHMAITAVFVEGVIFLILNLFKIREKIFDAIPDDLRKAVSMGIGFFIALIGLINAKIVMENSGTTIGHVNFKGGTFASGVAYNASDVGITALLALIGIFIVGVLIAKRVRGAILIGIVITWVLGIITELLGIYVPNPDIGMYSTIPSGIFGLSHISALSQTAFGLNFSYLATGEFWLVVFAFLFVDIFDTIGTLTGCAIEGGLIDKNGKIENMSKALEADAAGTIVGSLLGTSTVTSFVESTSGIADGARTGLSSIVTGVLFLLTMFFSPLFLSVPSFATAPALVAVGMMMIRGSAKELNWKDYTKALPAFLTMIMMPFGYSIATGIAYGFVSFTIIHLLVGEHVIETSEYMRKHKVYKEITVNTRDELNPALIILSILFIIKFIWFGN